MNGNKSVNGSFFHCSVFTFENRKIGFVFLFKTRTDKQEKKELQGGKTSNYG